MNLPITSFLYSVEDRAYMLDKLSLLEQGAFSTKKTVEEQVHDVFSLPVSEAFLQSMTEAKVVSSSAQSVQKFIKEQIQQIKSLPVVRLRMAINPTNDMVRSISKWFDVFIKDKLLVEVVVDPSVVGGVAIELNGTYSDYTVKKLLHEKLDIREPGNAAQTQP